MPWAKRSIVATMLTGNNAQKAEREHQRLPSLCQARLGPKSALLRSRVFASGQRFLFENVQGHERRT